MKLTSMKMSKADRKKSEPSSLATSESEAPRYPYGLSITLDEETLDKLGLALPKVGAKLAIQGRVTVTSVSSHEDAGGEKTVRRNVSLQITDLACEGGAGDKADALYKE